MSVLHQLPEANTHPAELLQQPVVLLRELAHGLGLVPVGLPQLDLLALQLTLQMLDVRLQLGHSALPLPLSALQTPTQLVLLLLQVLRVNQGKLVKPSSHFNTQNLYYYNQRGWKNTDTCRQDFSNRSFVYKINLSVK